MDISVLILSCDKNKDLTPFVKQTARKFLNLKIPTVIISEFDVSGYSGFDAIKSENIIFSSKLMQGLIGLKTKYVLILLDDYYVYDNNLFDKFIKWDAEVQKTNVLALRICKNYHLWKRTKGKTPKIYKNLNPYDIDFHPTIWDKNALRSIIEHQNLSAWEIEPLFSEFFEKSGNKAGISSTFIEFDELIVQGKFFRKPFKKFCESTYSGKKIKLTRTQEFKFKVKRFFYHITPRFLIRTFKKIINKKTYSN